MLDERLLEWVKCVPLRQAFDRLHRAPITFDGQCRTRADGGPVDEHSAGSTHLNVAGKLGAGEVESLADDIEDLRLWIRIAALDWRFANVPQVIGEHFVHSGSYWHTAFRYRSRQKALARVQHRAIRDLGLPRWFHVYPAGRSIYWLLPDSLKRAVRRSIGRSSERSASHMVPNGS